MSRNEAIEEEWRDIPIQPWEGIYQVSNLGRVRYAPRLLKPRKLLGYTVVKLRYRGRVQDNVGVHRLVAAAFIRAPKDGEVTNHLNADRSDNRIENLEWTTLGGNNAHTASLSRMARYPRHPLAKINPKVAVQMHKDGYSLMLIAKKFGCSRSAVCAMMKRMQREGKY